MKVKKMIKVVISAVSLGAVLFLFSGCNCCNDPCGNPCPAPVCKPRCC